MVYIPNPVDPTQPTGNVDASTADDEFRALKAYVQTLAFNAGLFQGIRQCAQDGVKDTNGYPAFFTAAGGGGLAIDLKATATPLSLNFAGGNNAGGQNDRIGYVTADSANILAALDPLNTDYIYADYVSQAVWTWGKTLVPPQYGFAYDRTKQSLMHFEGSNGSVVMIDDYGNNWLTFGNAVIDTSQFKIGTSSLKLDGATDFLETTNFTSLGGGSWTLEFYARWNALPGAATTQVLLNFGQTASTFGVLLGLNNTAGTIKTTVSLSSNGTAADITASTLGAKVAWVINQWYHFAVTYDALNSKYLVYVDGVVDTTVASALRVAGIARSRIGESNDASLAQMNGWIDEFRYSQCCRYPNGVVFIPSVVAGVVEGDFFDIQAYKMYSPTAASAVAGVNPTLTQKYRVYLGETDSNALAVSAVRNYAYNGRYKGIKSTSLPGPSTNTTINHNIGVSPSIFDVMAECRIAEAGFVPGDTIKVMGSQVGVAAGAPTVTTTKTTATVTAGTGTFALSISRTGFGAVGFSVANWGYYLDAQRGW